MRSFTRYEKINSPIKNVEFDSTVLNIWTRDFKTFPKGYRPIVEIAIDKNTEMIQGLRLISMEKSYLQYSNSTSPCSVDLKAKIERFIWQLKKDLNEADDKKNKLFGRAFLSKR